MMQLLAGILMAFGMGSVPVRPVRDARMSMIPQTRIRRDNMAVLLFILCLVLGFIAGYLYRDAFGGRKQVGGNNCIQIQTEEILLDADCNKEISDITSAHEDSHKNKLLIELTKMVNKAAQNG
jgi:hypothetical protein